MKHKNIPSCGACIMPGIGGGPGGGILLGSRGGGGGGGTATGGGGGGGGGGGTTTGGDGIPKQGALPASAIVAPNEKEKLLVEQKFYVKLLTCKIAKKLM